jgi:pimeloyl-ACP methyl ester carboxylesterase
MTTAPLLLLHAAASSSGQWKGVQRALGDAVRVIAPDLYGDGRSPGDFPPPGGALLAHEIAALRATVGDAGGRAHVVGHSYGALLALRMAIAHPEAVESLLVVEPIAFDLLAAEGDAADAHEIEALRVVCEDKVRAGDKEGAAERFVDYWTGAATFRALPGPQRAALAASMTKVAYGWREIAETPADYTKVAARTTVLETTHGPRTTRWIAERLAARVPGARKVVLAGAGHLAPVTHPGEVAREILAHLRA